MSLRSSLEARAPRRLTARLVKPGREADARRLAEQRSIVDLLGRSSERTEALVKAEEALASLEAGAADLEDVVEFEALPVAEFEALLAEHVDDEGEVDEKSMRPHLFARCATDPELQDVAWWREHLKDRTFTAGHANTLWLTAWEVNAGRGGIGGPLAV